MQKTFGVTDCFLRRSTGSSQNENKLSRLIVPGFFRHRQACKIFCRERLVRLNVEVFFQQHHDLPHVLPGMPAGALQNFIHLPVTVVGFNDGFGAFDIGVFQPPILNPLAYIIAEFGDVIAGLHPRILTLCEEVIRQLAPLRRRQEAFGDAEDVIRQMTQRAITVAHVFVELSGRQLADKPLCAGQNHVQFLDKLRPRQNTAGWRLDIQKVGNVCKDLRVGPLIAARDNRDRFGAKLLKLRPSFGLLLDVYGNKVNLTDRQELFRSQTTRSARAPKHLDWFSIHLSTMKVCR